MRGRFVAFLLCALMAGPAGAAPRWTHVTAWDLFSLEAPAGTVFHPMDSIDTFEGEFIGPDFTLHFQYGDFANPLTEWRDEWQFAVTPLRIDGRPALIAAADEMGRDPWECRRFATATYVVAQERDIVLASRTRVHQSTALLMSGCAAHKEAVPIMQQIFRTIRFNRRR